MPDLMQSLDASRPTGAELDLMWPKEQRADTLTAILASSRASARRRRRGAWVAAAAVTAGLVVVPSVVDSGSAAAQADLRTLAVAAVSNQRPVIAEGTFLHLRTEAVQRNSRLFGDGRTLDTNRESWVRWDGKTWAIDSRPSAGWREYFVFARPRPELSGPTPELAASLPDEPDALEAYLDAHVSGSDSHEEALFVAVTDLVRSNFLPPETLAAALHVLADVDGIETDDVNFEGRPAVRISFSRFWTGLIDRHSVTVDRQTARVLTERSWNPGGSYEQTTTLVEVVDEIPVGVRKAYDRLGEKGARVYD